MKNRNIVFWSDTKHCEFLHHESLSDLVQEKRDIGLSSGKIKVYGWARREIDQHSLLEFVMDATSERVDEEYFFENPHEPCDLIKEAAKYFVKIYAENTIPFLCDIVHEEIIDLVDFNKEQNQ